MSRFSLRSRVVKDPPTQPCIPPSGWSTATVFDVPPLRYAFWMPDGEISESGEKMRGSWWRTPLLYLTARLQQREDQVFLVLALVIGALTGLAVVAFILLTERVGMRLYPVGGAPWRRLLFPVAGSLGIGYLLSRYFPDARGSGVPQTKAALFARGGRITMRTVVGKFFCTSATLASGIPLGREGPSVQVGAGIASVLGRRLGLRPEKVKALLPVGAAAAIAAAFNTPLAAVLFSLEEIVGDLHAPVLGSVVLASATSWMVLRLLLGNNPLFKVPQYQLVHPLEFAIYAVLGVAGGLVSVSFTKLLLGMRARFLRFPKKTVWFQPVAGGLLVGLLGLFVPQVLGVGYGYVGDVLNGRMALSLMLLLVVLKLLDGDHKLCVGQRGRYFWPCPVHWRDVGRGCRHGGTSFLACLHRDSGCLCISRDGRGLCGYRARSDDLGADDLRDDAGLCRHRPADDCELGEPFHFLTTAAGANLRSLSSAGWHTPPDGGGTPTTGTASDNPSHARSDRVAAKRDYGWGGSAASQLE